MSSRANNAEVTITFSQWIKSLLCIPICDFFQETSENILPIEGEIANPTHHSTSVLPVSLYDFASKTREEITKEDCLDKVGK